ncbi:MAG: EamA family transporter [Lachnospiraceae bacterium]|nr:EamA family transporter [Lachnospiraceae bacterium]
MSGEKKNDDKAGKMAAGGEPSAKKRVTMASLLIIQAGVILYTCSGICSKMTSNFAPFSFGWLFWIGLEVFCLGAYAIFWQQIIKHFDLSIAYANRATAIFWSTIWAMLLFGEKITPANTLGILVIFAGIMLVNSDMKE